MHSLLLIYHSIVDSHLNYAISIWGPMLKERDIERLQIIQNNSLRHIFKVKPRVSLAYFYNSSKILKIADQIKL